MARYSWIILAILLVSCQGGRHDFPNDMEKVEIDVVRFDTALLHVRTDSTYTDLSRLYEEYPRFMPMYVEDILGLDCTDTALLSELYADFLQDTVMGFAQTNQVVLQKFADIEDIEEELTVGFTRLHYLYPEWPMPEIYFFVSGFNASVYSYENMYAAGVDMYLGSEYAYYNQVVYNYQKTTMDRRYLAGDVLNFYIMQHMPYTSKTARLLDFIIFRGKQMYLLAQLLPDATEAEVIGYTEEQWDWCENFEKEIWYRIMDKRDLFKTEQMVLTSYLNDGPFTAEISQEAPGRIGIWVGWRIVDSYMRHHPEVSIQQLMAESDAQKILEYSYYKP